MITGNLPSIYFAEITGQLEEQLVPPVEAMHNRQPNFMKISDGNGKRNIFISWLGKQNKLTQAKALMPYYKIYV